MDDDSSQRIKALLKESADVLFLDVHGITGCSGYEFIV